MRIRKRDRNKLKNPDPLSGCERIQANPVPLEVSANLLCSPKLTARSRKLYLTSREFTVYVPRSEAIAEPIKYARKLSRLSLMQVLREIKKNARRAATAKNILSEISPQTTFGSQVLAEQNRQLHRMRQAVAERASRTMTTTSPDQAVK